MGKILPGLDLFFSISRVRRSRLTQVMDCSPLMASRKADHMPCFSFEEAKHGDSVT